ncbi:fused MFS/spermidine synthase [Bacillus sp. AFS040349]|uniref:fused MFS/spermidine synthase n=1 Tax=Bacillus sp. AFS040349 TaxID=2033502 RepID=UPI000BFCBDFD|nr:fused MFS/spermidine synthase [Bacillus sp. AFS040349]PGT79593.1 spermidine synthase [Bacillus sp. AFS040349]
MSKKIYFKLFIVSFIIMGLEMTATRYIAPTFGNTVYTWGIIISIFLIGSSTGYIIGGYVADQKAVNKIMQYLYIFGILTIALIPMLKSSIFPYLESLSSIWGTTIGVVTLYFVPNLTFSSIVTVLMKDRLDNHVSGKIIGNLHTASAMGSVMGTLVTTFFLIPSVHINSVIGIFACMIFIVFLIYFEAKTKSQMILLLISIIFVMMPFLSTKLQSSEILYKTTSLYHNIFVYESDYYNGSNGNYRYLTFGNETTIQGMVDINHPNKLVLDYAKNIWEISNTFAQDSDKVFIIGHGIGTLTRKYEQENKDVKVAEIDKDVLEISRRYFRYKGNSVEIGDGRKILKEEQDKFDVIVLDAYNNTVQIPFHLTSKEFFYLTIEKLNDNGVLIINSIGNPKKDILIESINTTLKSVYPYVYIFANGEKDGLQNLTIVGSKKHLDDKKVKGQQIVKVKEGKLILDGDTKLHNLN